MQVQEKKDCSTFNPASKAETIQAYVDAGFTLIRLAGSDGKVPIDKNWQKTEYNMRANPNDYPNNYGVKLDDTDLIIDYDHRNDKSPDKGNFKRFMQFIGPIGNTLVIKTAANGIHVYLKKPAGVKFHKNADKIMEEFSGIELKSKGAQVVGPHSIRFDLPGNPAYAIAQGSPFEIAECPQILIDTFKKQEIDFSKQTGLDTYQDDAQTIDRYIQHLRTTKPAIQNNFGDERTLTVAGDGRRFGLSPGAVTELIWEHYNPRCVPQWDYEDLKVKVRNAFTYTGGEPAGIRHPASDFDILPMPVSNASPIQRMTYEEKRYNPAYDKSGKLIRSLHNTALLLSTPESPLHNKIFYNSFAQQIEFSERMAWHSAGLERCTWSDADAVHAKMYLSRCLDYHTTTNEVHEAVLTLAYENKKHPVQDYLNQISWDGIPRIHRWLTDYAGVELNEYTSAVGEKTLFGAVARVFFPGATKMDHTLVLEGEQGVGKSTLCRILGKKWYGDVVIDPHNKDTIDYIRNKWIIELSEMVCARKSEADALKSFLSKECDTARLAYRHNSEDYPRQCIFIGTINPEAGRGYLKDPTGNRRYWPVVVGQVKIRELLAVVDQLWAEAVHVFRTDKERSKLYLEGNVRDEALKRANERYESDPYQDRIEDYLANIVENDGSPRDWTTLQEILDCCLYVPISKQNKPFKDRVASCLHILGWKYTVKKLEGKSKRCYKRPMLDL